MTHQFLRMKSFNSCFSLKSLEKQGKFCGYASVFHITDLQKDQIMPGAFTFSLNQWKKKQKWPFLLWQHQLTEPIGFWEMIYENEKGLFVEGQLLLDLRRGKEAYILMKAGVLEGLSIGFYSLIERQQEDIRKIFQVDLVEISLVTLAANPLARLESVKFPYV